MDRLIFVSTGRCGTTRLTEILGAKLPEQYVVTHVMPFSRLANVAGNLMLAFGQLERVKRFLYKFITSRYTGKKGFVCTDPLTAMIIPREYVESGSVLIVHVVRSRDSFASSMFRFSRKRTRSFIAHNFIPFWMPRLFPLENLFSKNILEKYREIARVKNEYFETHYSGNPNYMKITMEELFEPGFLERVIKNFFKIDIDIAPGELKIKSNESKGK